jgi:hypothetical protein
MMKSSRRLPLGVLAGLICACALPAGCETLHISPLRVDRSDLQTSDFPLRHDLPLFNELAELRESVHKTLQLPTSNRIIQVYLFEDRARFERFMEAKYPDLPKRRAFFMTIPPAVGDEQLQVFTYWGGGERIQQDLRHELTHALLHSVLKDVPIWLDEGLAEYFELPAANDGVNVTHLRQLCRGANGPVQPDMARLEKLKRVEDMTPPEYRESWAWVHLMLHSSPEARKVLLSYLREMRTTATPGLLRPRLATVYSAPEEVLERHLILMDNSVQAAGLSR